MKGLYKSFVMKILAILFISALFCFITNTGFSQWLQTSGPQGAEMRNIKYNGTNTLFAQSEHFIYRSYNNGSSWTLLSCPSKNPYKIFASKAMVFVEDGNGGVYRSTNSGTNWDFVTALGNNLINTIAFYNDSVYLSISGGLYISPDKGTNWTYYPSSFDPGFGDELFFVGNTLYASCNISNTYSFIKSTNYGRSFALIPSSTTPKNITLSSFIYTNGVFFSTFVYDGIYKSTDSCQTWSKVFSAPDFPQIRLKYGNGKLYAYSYDSLYMSADTGITWSYVCSFTGSLGSIEFVGNRMFAGMYKIGVYRSTNGGYNWIASYNGMKELWVSGLLTIGNYVYTSHSGAGINRTTGASWQKYSGDLPNDLVTAMYLDSNILYAASSSGLYRSTNNGLNWVFLISCPTSTSIECVYASQGNIYFGTSRRGLFVSHDDGNTWGVLSSTSGITSIENVNENIFYSTHNTHSAPSGSVHRSSDNGLSWLDVSIPNSPRPQTVKLQRHNGNIFGISKDKLYKSTDFGLNWIKYQATFEDSTFTSLHSNKGILYCGTSTSGGKYYLRYSTDNGLSFNKLGDSLPAEITNIAVKGNYIYAGVKYYSVWRFFKPVITAENNEAGMLPATYSLKQNYPNPFNPTTKFKYDVARLSNVKIVIYDVTGREMQTLVNESLKPGTYEASFEGSLLTSGVYFYKLITDGFTETKKMLLIK